MLIRMGSQHRDTPTGAFYIDVHKSSCFCRVVAKSLSITDRAEHPSASRRGARSSDRLVDERRPTNWPASYKPHDPRTPTDSPGAGAVANPTHHPRTERSPPRLAASRHPAHHSVDHLGLPDLCLWLHILRVVMHGKAMLRTADLDEPMISLLPFRRQPRAFDRDEGVPGTVNDKRGRGDLGNDIQRLDPEHFVEHGSTVRDCRRMTQVPVIGQPTGSLVIQVTVNPVRLLVDVAIFVIQLRIQKDQPLHCGRTFRSVVSDESTTEACTEQARFSHAGLLTHISRGNVEVVQRIVKVLSSCRPSLSPCPRKS